MPRHRPMPIGRCTRTVRLQSKFWVWLRCGSILLACILIRWDWHVQPAHGRNLAEAEAASPQFLGFPFLSGNRSPALAKATHCSHRYGFCDLNIDVYPKVWRAPARCGCSQKGSLGGRARRCRAPCPSPMHRSFVRHASELRVLSRVSIIRIISDI